MTDTEAAAEAGEVQIVQLNGTYEAFGLVMDFLCRIQPFAGFEAKALADAVTQQLRRSLHLVAMCDRRVVGYAGWLMTTPEIGQRWLEGTGPLTPKHGPEAVVAALTIVTAPERSTVTRLIRGARNAVPKGCRIVFKRGGENTGRSAKKATVISL
jgi:hypothetical protein